MRARWREISGFMSDAARPVPARCAAYWKAASRVSKSISAMEARICCSSVLAMDWVPAAA